MSLGHISKFKVDRETQLGYMLVDENKEYFLHRNECNFKVLNSGDTVSAFIYVDKKGREAATLHLPSITLDNIGFGVVKTVKNEMGAFIDIGISKDILLSKDELPPSFRMWPKEGDEVSCLMKVRADKLILKLASKNDFLKQVNDIRYAIDEHVDAFVYRITDEGINLVTKDFKVIFVYKAHLRGTFRIGEKVNVRIIFANENDYSGSLLVEKKEQIQNDKEVILEYLKSHNGVMMITEDAPAELISHNFHMSKSSFKHAIGGLLKENLIEKLEDKIVLL